jgi:hypothetical protein
MSNRSRSELLLLGTIADWAYNDKLLIDEKVKIGVTPGHVFLCGAGRFQGRHVPLIDILRDDGAVVRQDGSLMRASTGCVVGSGSETIRKARCGVRFSPRMHAPSARSLTSLLNLKHVSCLERHKANEA